MSLHKITAGVGYDYLTRQVAALDSSEKGHTGLASYYTQRGETPGRWVGSGLVGIDGLDAGDPVTAEQMRALFGSGHHPLARQRQDALPPDASVAEIHAATRLGQPFKVFEHDVPAFLVEIARRCAAFNAALGLPSDAPVPRAERARIRTEVGREVFLAEFGRPPADARELHGHIARLSRPQTTAVAGFDLTFSPVKSVSALWALADPRVAAVIERAHNAAVTDALRFLETHALFTRTGTQAVRQVEVTGLVAAAFTHRDSRAGDPDLHTHVAVANKVQTLDGRWLAIDGRPLYKAIVAASETYNTALEAHLAATLPVRFEARPQPDPRKRPVRELVGVDPALNLRWSARRVSIEQRQAELAADFQRDHGRPPTPAEARSLAQQATLDTRPTKHEPRTLAEQRRAWRAQAEGVLGRPGVDRMLRATLDPRTTRMFRTPTRRWVRTQAHAIIATLEQSRATWQDWHVRAEALRVARTVNLPLHHLDTTVARLTHTALTRYSIALTAASDGITEPPTLRRRDGTSVYHQAGSIWHTSSRILAAEQRLTHQAGRRDGRTIEASVVDVALLEAEANRTPLNAGQAALVRAMATSGARLQLAIAPAGSGKTTAMAALASAWTSSGGHLIGLAPSAGAAAQLAGQIGTHADTLALLTHALTHQLPLPGWAARIGPDTLVVIDEAGMADTLTLDTVVEFVLDRGGSVRLIGDDQQLAAIGAGGVLRDIATQHGALRLNELLRFADPAEGAASLALRDGDAAALGFYLDQHRIHVGTLTSCTDQVFHAWLTDRTHGRDALMLAPTRDLVADLNARAQQHLHGHVPAAGVELADGNTATIGDLIITRSNERRLATSGTDWVRNGDRWQITAITPNGALHAHHQTTGHHVLLPAGYVHASVELGYACTIHTAQGVTADTMHGVAAGTETRQQLYTMLTRGRHANHLHLAVVGDGDEHTLLRPETITPPTATDLLEAILRRDDSPTSATTTRTLAAQPPTQLADATARYTDAVTFAAEQTAGPAVLAQLDAAAHRVLPGLTDAPAWPTLRAHLLLIAAHGDNPITALTTAADQGPLGNAADPAAVLDWRLDPTGRRNTQPGPLPWLPGIPTKLAHHPDWADYLTRRHQRVTDLANHIRITTAHTTTLPAWAPPGPGRPDPDTIADIAVWRAAHSVPDTDTRPTGETQHAAAERRHQHRLDRRVIDTLAPAAAEWTPLITTTAPATTGDPYTPVLAHRLAQAASIGLDAPALLRAATGEGDLPDDHPAAALWWRINRHLTGGVATSLDISHTDLLTGWLPRLETLTSPQRAAELQTSPWWPALVSTIETALARGWQLEALLTDPPTIGTDIDPCQALVWRTAVLLTPLPDDPGEPSHDHAGDDGVHPWPDALDEPPDPETLPPDPLDHALPDQATDTPPANAPATLDAAVLEPVEFDLAHSMEALIRRGIGPIDLPQADLNAQLDRADAWRDSPYTPERLAQINQLAADFYQACYRGSWARDYLTSRFHTDLTGDPDIQPGYAPSGWTTLINHLHRRGVTDPELLATGLVSITRTGRFIDRFRDRVVFPISHDDQILGFVARRNPNLPDYLPHQGPKYLNTPDTLLFHKRAQLYIAGRRHLDTGATPVIVEGPADAIAITQATHGRYVGVAPLGTNLTHEQVTQLRHMSVDPIVATDNDPAGQTAAQRHYWILTPHQLHPRHAHLPHGTDPADLLATDHADELVRALDAAIPLAHTLIDERLTNLPAAQAALEALAINATQPPETWTPTLHHIAHHLDLPADLLVDPQLAHARAFNNNPARYTEQQLGRIGDVRDRLHKKNPGSGHGADVTEPSAPETKAELERPTSRFPATLSSGVPATAPESPQPHPRRTSRPPSR